MYRTYEENCNAVQRPSNDTTMTKYKYWQLANQHTVSMH